MSPDNQVIRTKATTNWTGAAKPKLATKQRSPPVASSPTNLPQLAGVLQTPSMADSPPEIRQGPPPTRDQQEEGMEKPFDTSTTKEGHAQRFLSIVPRVIL